ncbi:MAG: DUF4330 domain-containing protein [Candidatus Omnitrophica bacterium]|nr:DUF4330 domain-containing protein [Candidatus Omnitrophota bacterium]MBU0881137.1 DUF4330 domain-containing protein [Candidatus Omnitrophota bacterium]MBU1808068.1 DUF4330 domain-containing protein [Candidatus Omnitrophota bacterium]
MKFIDKKGKLFGMINVFDLFVILMLVLSIFFVYKWIRMAEDPSWVNVKILHTRCIAVAELPPYLADLVKEGDEAYNDDGLVVARVEKVSIKKEERRPGAVVYTSKNGEKLFFSSDASVTAIIMSIQVDLLSYERKGDVYAVLAGSGTPIRVGTTVGLKTKKYLLQFSVRKIISTGDK